MTPTDHQYAPTIEQFNGKVDTDTTIPFTGLEVVFLIVIAILVLALGFGMRALARAR